MNWTYCVRPVEDLTKPQRQRMAPHQRQSTQTTGNFWIYAHTD